MARLLLYQGLAEPVLVSTVEIVTVDKWFVSHPSAVPAYSTKRGERATFVADPTQFAESVRIDKWFVALPVQVPAPKAKLGGIAFLVDPSLFTEAVTLDKWFVQSSAAAIPASRAKRGDPAVIVVASFPETTTVDKWISQSGQPPVIKRTALGAYAFVELLGQDPWDWFVQQPNNVIKMRERAGESVSITEPSLFSRVSLDQWFVRTALLARRPDLAAQGWYSLVEFSVPVTVFVEGKCRPLARRKDRVLARRHDFVLPRRCPGGSMDIIAFNERLGKSAVEPYTIDCTNDIAGLSGATMPAAGAVTATHTPPSGSALTITKQVSGNKVTIFAGALAVLGTHYIDVLIPYGSASGATVHIRFTFVVDF